jgi:hypothetical protein
VTFANIGDVVGTDIATLVVDKEQLAITTDVVVPGYIARVQQLLREAPHATTLGPFTAEEANIRTTKARGMCYFPFELVEPLLGADLNARQIFELVIPALLVAGLEDNCASLVDFFTVALVSPSLESPEPLTLQDQAYRPSYVPGPANIAHRHKYILYRDLPLLRAAPFAAPPSDPSLLDVARGGSRHGG